MASDNKVSSETSDKLVAKLSRVKSVVWGYFGFKLDAEGKAKLQDFLICPLCKVSARGANSSNLFAHLKVHHPLKHAEVIQAKKASGKDRESSKAAYSGQTSLLTALRPAQKYNRKSKSGRNLRTQWCHVWQRTWCQFIVEKEGFCQLLHSFDPQYELPSRKLYAKTRETVAAEVCCNYWHVVQLYQWALHEPYGALCGRRLDTEDPMLADPLPSTRPHLWEHCWSAEGDTQVMGNWCCKAGVSNHGQWIKHSVCCWPLSSMDLSFLFWPQSPSCTWECHQRWCMSWSSTGSMQETCCHSLS